MSLKIIKAGVQDTVQDMGRYGYQQLGINPGGAMDKFSAQVANLMVGNDIEKAVIELYFPASVFMFQQPALIALSGADFSASINGEKVPGHHPFIVNKNSILQFHKPLHGARAYLAVHGGLDVPVWLGSRSTHLKAGFGGYNGRALHKDDEIGFGISAGISSLPGEKEFTVLPWLVDDNWGDITKDEVLALPGN